jgi:quercetin dioxygenase-like cupin family protein
LLILKNKVYSNQTHLGATLQGLEAPFCLKHYFIRTRKEETVMFTKRANDGYKKILEGIRLKTLVYGEKSLLAEFRLEKGHRLPVHAHPQEQTGYLVAGRMRLSIAGETVEVKPGDSWCVPGGVEHGAEILADAIAIEVFSPVREDYLPERLL